MYWKKRVCFIICMVMLISLVGCSHNKVEVPKSSNYYRNKDYKKVSEELKDVGFKSIKTKQVEDVLEIDKVNKIKSISIDGDKVFNKEKEYDKDSKILIEYHVMRKLPVPFSSTMVNNLDYKQVEEEFKRTGFVNVSVLNMEDLTTDKGDGKVKEVTVGDSSKYKVNKKVSADEEITILYHGLKQVTAPITSKKSKGQNYKKIIKKFKKAGFTNVKTKKIDDLITGWLIEDGEVEKVTINGKKYKTDKTYNMNEKVLVYYHTFPKDSTENKTDEQNDTTSYTQKEEQLLTPSNCPELKTILELKDPYDSRVEQFVKNHYGDIIEFDANVANCSMGGDDTTRYNYLIHYGNYSISSSSGPEFQISNANKYDLNISSGPQDLKVGTNIHIKAKVLSYNSFSGLFKITSVSITMR